LEAVHALLRKDIAPHHVDRYLAPDMAHATQMVRDGSVARVLRTLSGLPKLWIPG
jgi:histidine ammonia-lyase